MARSYPDDKFTKDQMYKSPEGVHELMNGFLLNMGSNSLYGEKLTLVNLDLMAHLYKVTHIKSPYYPYVYHQFTQAGPDATFSNIWTNMYAIVANINDFVKELPTVENGMNNTDKEILIGSSIGIRAFLHFDLLRLFGPAYSLETKDKPAIPYYRALSTEINPILSSEQVIQEILQDIETAKLMLQSDARTSPNVENLKNDYFNYYAVVALEARVQQWAGNKQAALAAAKQVIYAQERFPWVTHAEIAGNGVNPDRKFSNEIIFSVFNHRLYDVQQNTFDSNLLENNLLATGADNLVSLVYEGKESDYRFTFSWPFASTGVGYRTFVKYQDLQDNRFAHRFLVPLIRLSEMHYIAAESSEDPTEALEYLNTVRQHRNLAVDITDYALFEQELTKEYQKEFYGEGQLWYYYKRKQVKSIFSVNTANNKYNMTSHNYNIPLPDVEITGR